MRGLLVMLTGGPCIHSAPDGAVLNLAIVISYNTTVQVEWCCPRNALDPLPDFVDPKAALHCGARALGPLPGRSKRPAAPNAP